MNEEIKILDVIHHYDAYSSIDRPMVCIVVDRKPVFVYTQEGNFLHAHDGGFYNFYNIEPGTTRAFAGSEFTINLADGTQRVCKGDTWGCGGKVDGVPLMQVGYATLDKLKECHVYYGGTMAVSKYTEWLAHNKPSHNYSKYDSRDNIDAVYALYNDDSMYFHRVVCPKRARTLRKRGVTIFKKPGCLTWSPSYERRIAEIKRRQHPDYLGDFHPYNRKKKS